MYNDSFVSYCESRDMEKIKLACRRKSALFIQIQQGVDVAARKNDLEMLLTVLFIPRHLSVQLVRYAQSICTEEQINYFCSYENNPKYLHCVMIAAIYPKSDTLYRRIERYITDDAYINLRMQAIDHSITYDRYYAPEKQREKRECIRHFSRNIKLPRTNEIKRHLGILLDINSNTMSEIVNLLKICEYANKMELSADVFAVINPIKFEYINKYITKDIANIIIEYL